MPPTRRDFLKASLGASTLVSLGPAGPTLLTRAALAAPKNDCRDTVLVVVQMAGGNDGLNTVVPYEDDVYARNRPTLRAVAKKVHKIDSLLGFHPEMQGFARLYKEGYLSVLQGVGYPNPSGDHAAAMRDWQTARPHDNNCQTGWLGRAVDLACRPGEASVPAVFVGQIAQPLGLGAEKSIIPTIRSLQDCMLHDMPGPGGGPEHRRSLANAAKLPRAGNTNPLLGFLQRGILDAYAAGRQIEAVAGGVARASRPPSAGTARPLRASHKADRYPPFQLARWLSTIAQLIRADVGIRIFYTEVGGEEPGGFDNHANQLGNHGALLRQLSESLAAFVDDLKRDKLLDRVLLMTFSEFGRTIKENGRRGTGHGSAAPMFLAGGKLRGGLIGENPNLTDLENGGQKHHTDFRRVYATVLDRWLGFDSRSVLGEDFQPLDLLRA